MPSDVIPNSSEASVLETAGVAPFGSSLPSPFLTASKGPLPGAYISIPNVLSSNFLGSIIFSII